MGFWAWHRWSTVACVHEVIGRRYIHTEHVQWAEFKEHDILHAPAFVISSDEDVNVAILAAFSSGRTHQHFYYYTIRSATSPSVLSYIMGRDRQFRQRIAYGKLQPIQWRVRIREWLRQPVNHLRELVLNRRRELAVTTQYVSDNVLFWTQSAPNNATSTESRARTMLMVPSIAPRPTTGTFRFRYDTAQISLAIHTLLVSLILAYCNLEDDSARSSRAYGTFTMVHLPGILRPLLYVLTLDDRPRSSHTLQSPTCSTLASAGASPTFCIASRSVGYWPSQGTYCLSASRGLQLNRICCWLYGLYRLS
jgi:hypothetical protein